MSNLNLFGRLRRIGAVSGVAAAALVGCGGGSGEAQPQSPREVPASATTSVPAWTGFAGSLAPSDTDDPLPLEGVAPPVSEIAEPAPVS